MNWRFWEKRQNQPPAMQGDQPTFAPLSPFLEAALGRRIHPLDALTTAAGEGCVRLISASFEAARIENAPMALTACFMGDLIREMLKRGEAIAVISVDEGMLTLELGHSYEVKGDSPNRDEWMYTVGIGRPSTAITVQRPGSSILHLTYGAQAENPWLGVGPAAFGDKALSALGALDKSVREESASSTGQMQNVTIDSVYNIAENPLTAAESLGTRDHYQRLSNLEGGLFLEVQPRERGIQDGGMGKNIRLGPRFTPDVVNMMRDIQHRACAVFGVPPGLLFGASDGTADRESYRRFLLTTLQPMAARLLPELRTKLDAPALSISFDTLRGSDLQGLARGIKGLIDSGLSQEQALRLAGVETD